MTWALELEHIGKRFGTVEALTDATMRVRAGSMHALLGENGAGKTTLMRIAYGLTRADHGSLRIHGEDAILQSSADAIARGVGMVHQHFMLVPAMTVAENVSLGMRGAYNAERAAERVRAVGDTTGLRLDPAQRVSELPVSAQQRLEIVKALARNARLLILDEPTAGLAPTESEELMAWLRRYRATGNSVVLITHKLPDAIANADEVTVLRRGASVLAGPLDTFDERALVRAMLGEELAASSPVVLPATRGAVVLKLRDVTVSEKRGRQLLHGVSLDVHEGEIVGVAAMEQSGVRELLRVLAGRLAPTSGEALIPDDVGFVPEDRHHDALVLEHTLAENMALRDLGARSALGIMPWRQIIDATLNAIRQFDVRAEGPRTRAKNLSGGNQQKLVLAREMSTQPRALVAENPTRGLDIRATAAVLDKLRAARDGGSAVVVYSSDLDEVLLIADRVIVVHDGRIQQVDDGRDAVGRAMLGTA